MLARLQRSGFARNVLILASGAAGAQAINALVAPVLTRLFDPIEIGQLGLFLAFIQIAAIALSLRYEQAIVLPGSGAIAARLATLSLALVPIMSGLSGLALAALVALGAAGYGSLSPIAVPLAVLGLTGLGTFGALRYWLIRGHAYRQISEVQVLQGLVRAIVQVGAGLVEAGVTGLLAGDVTARLAGLVGVVRASWQPIRLARQSPGPSVASVARGYWRFPLFGVPSSLINAAAAALPVPLVAATYGLEMAGFLALVQRVLGVPLSVVGASAGDAVLSRMSEHARSDPAVARPFFRRTALGLAVIGIPAALILAVLGPPLFGLVFGAAWRDAGVAAAIMSPWLLSALIVSPLSRVAIVYQGQGRKLIYDVLSLAAVVGGFLGSAAAGLDAFEAIGLVTALQVGAYVVYFVVLYRMVGGGRFQEQPGVG